MKTAKLIKLERKRHALMDDARSILAEIESAPDKARRDLEKKHDAAMRALDLNKLDMDQERLDEADEAARSARPPNMAGEGYGTDLTPSVSFARAWGGEDRSGWIDN